MEYYCLDENHASGTLNSRYIGCQNPYQLQNLKILLTFQGHKNSHGQNLIFLPEQKSTCGHITSCINLTMKNDKIVLISPKAGQK